MTPVSSDRAWYMTWNWALATYALAVGAGLLYWLGPIVIARGLARWSQMPK